MSRQHDTEGVRKHAVDASLWWEFKPGQRVRTREGLLGTVTAVEDGPHAGNEHYLVELDGGMGGGEYSSSELMATTERTASKQSAELHVASDDYPVLEDILEERPPIENVQQKWAAQTENYSDEVRSAPPIPADLSTYDTKDTDRRWEDPQYYDKAYESSLKGDLNEHVGFFFRSEPGVGRSYDWCRFRRQQHCFYPKAINEAATKIEGVPVWTPEDRGICSRHDWDEQRACPVSEPGPRSRETIYYPDATVPYEAGGQRRDNYRAFHTNYKAPLTNFDLIRNVTLSMKDPDFAMHYTGAWTDVMNKARYLRRSGNVFIFSAPEQGSGNTDFIVGEVLGDSGIPYRVRLMREPGRRRVAMWECGCAWGHFAWGRSGRWKKFEGRMCSHALALVYETQGREGFSGENQIWENTEVPIWRDADEEPQERHPVTDDSYRDWRVGSLDMPEGTDFGMEREGNWRPIGWHDDFEYAPIVMFSAHEVMSAEANKNASKGGFPVKWRGQEEWVVQMDTGSSSVVLSNGVETNCYELLHPRYHPTLGLSLSDSGDFEPMYKGASRRKGRLETSARVYYRVHNPNERPFIPETAVSNPLHNSFDFFDVEQGFSAVSNPWALWYYIMRMGWLQSGYIAGNKVMMFTGGRVGVGHDREPLVVPDMALVREMSWDEFEQELVTTPLPALWSWDAAPSGNATFERVFSDIGMLLNNARQYGWDDSPALAVILDEAAKYEPDLKAAVLKDEPEPALPYTEADEDEELAPREADAGKVNVTTLSVGNRILIEKNHPYLDTHERPYSEWEYVSAGEYTVVGIDSRSERTNANTGRAGRVYEITLDNGRSFEVRPSTKFKVVGAVTAAANSYDDFLFEAEKPRPMQTLDAPDEQDDTPPPPEPTPVDEEEEEPEDTMQLESMFHGEHSVPRPEWLMSGGGSRKSSGSDGGISNSDIAAQAKKVLAAKTFSPEEQADLIGEGEGTVAARNLDRLDIAGTHYEALERIGEEEEDNFEDMWGMLL